MKIKELYIVDTLGNKQGPFSAVLFNSNVMELSYPKHEIDFNRNYQIIVPLANNEEIRFKIVSYQFNESFFDTPEFYSVTLELKSFPNSSDTSEINHLKSFFLNEYFDINLNDNQNSVLKILKP